MEQLEILERIYDNLFDSLEPGTPIYIFAAAIYDTWWHKGNELEQNLAKRLVAQWEGLLCAIIDDKYRATKYNTERLEYDDYCMMWIESKYKYYSDNEGARRALQNIWENRYGLRINWPN